MALRAALCLLLCAGSAAAEKPKAATDPKSAPSLASVPLNPAYDRDHLYALPFDPRVHWLVGQGNSDDFSHSGRAEFAFDFAMPQGTPVLASRAGTVVEAIDGFRRCCLPLDRAAETNTVFVLHPDGSFASYAHLRPGVPVKRGQRVEQGELIGYSGITGYAKVPHLHFQVSIRDSPGTERSVPIRFRNAAGAGYTPKAWRLYENRPPATVRLRVSVAGRRVVRHEALVLASHAPIQLRVERIDAPGAATDVTRDPATRYFALTPWGVDVDAGGRVSFRTSRDWAPLVEYIRRGVAIVTILFEAADGQRAAFDARFVFEDMRKRKPSGAGS